MVQKNIIIFVTFLTFPRDSWKELEGMSTDEAKQNYIKVLLEMCDKAGEQVKLQ
jgi:acyl-CoA-binding protein